MACLLLMLPLLGATADDSKESPSDTETRSADSRKLLEDVLMARLTRELALDEAQAVLMMRHMAEYRDRLMTLRKERSEKLRALRQAVRESKDEAQIAACMKDVKEANAKNMMARDEVFDAEGLELTTWQQARLMIFLNDFEGDMRRLLKRAQERHAQEQKGRPRGTAAEASEGASRSGREPEAKKKIQKDGAGTKEPAPAG
tara:strand:- start:101 stop:706 length:606 start_codon:yes stop_codon:yes gene_type:complete